MIISLDKYKATGGGSGGNTEVVNSGGELTMKEFIEEVRIHQDWTRTDYKYVSSGVYGENGDVIYYSFYRSDSIIPYTNLYGTDEPLHEVYYDSNNSQFDFIRNENGDVANVITTDAFNCLYQTKIYKNKYVWNFKSYQSTIPVYLGKLCQRVSSFNEHPLYNFVFGYASVFDESDLSSSWVQPCEYYMTKPNFDEENWDSFDVYLNDSDNSNVYYKDGHGLYGSDYEIRGLVKVVPTTNDYGWYEDIPSKINIDKFVITNNNGTNEMIIGYMSTNLNNENPVVNINELAYLYGDIKLCNRFAASVEKFSTTYVCAYNIGGNLDYNLELDNFTGSKYNGFMFKNVDKIKTINVKLNGYDETAKSFKMIFNDCKSLEKINFDYNGLVKIKSGDAGFLIDNKTQYFPSLNNMFFNCKSLISIPPIDSSEVVSMENFIHGCRSLKSLPLLDASKLRSASYIFGFDQLNNFTDFGGFKNLSVDCKDTFYYCPNLTVESLMNVINNLATVSGKTLQLGSHHLNKLTAEQIAVATSKGWTLT